MLEECIKPAKAKNVRIIPEQKFIKFEVSDEDLSVVIGKKGSNAKLTSRLLGWRLDIEQEAKQSVGINDKLQAAAGSLAQILPNITEHQAMILANNGLNGIETFHDVTV